MTIQIGGGYRLPGLRSLQLRQVVPGPTLVQLIDVIENSPNLHILAIFESEVAIASHEVQNMKRPTLTPGMLDALKLSGLSPEATCALLSCLTIHNQSNFLLNVSLVLNRDEAEAIMAFAFRHVGSLSPSYFEVKISDRRYTLNHEWEEWYIALSSVEGDATEDFVHVVNDRLTKAVPELHNVQATLRIDMEVVDLLPIMSVMDNLLDITALVLIAPLQISVLKPLSRPLSSGRWLLPNLEDLTICPYDTLVDSTLPQMIRARWKASDKKKHGDSNPGVIPIDTVYIDGEGEITQEAQTWLATTKLIQHFYIDSDKILIA
ncbi:hypothetical protein FRB99_001733 [Tulasnella sp. 403]|nr:hypothetical protein FRB99_001733 [Tulasnella sp. 403]